MKLFVFISIFVLLAAYAECGRIPRQGFGFGGPQFGGNQYGGPQYGGFAFPGQSPYQQQPFGQQHPGFGGQRPNQQFPNQQQPGQQFPNQQQPGQQFPNQQQPGQQLPNQQQGQVNPNQQPQQQVTQAPAVTTTLSPQVLACIERCLDSTPGNYNPVCGSDFVAYQNPEKFECANDCGANLTILRRGACPSRNQTTPRPT